MLGMQRLVGTHTNVFCLAQLNRACYTHVPAGPVMVFAVRSEGPEVLGPIPASPAAEAAPHNIELMWQTSSVM
jgi:hypothetical protein